MVASNKTLNATGYMYVGTCTLEDCHIDLSKLCHFGGARLIIAEVIGINTTTKEILCADGRPAIRYDVLVLNLGISPKLISLPSSISENVTPVKPISSFASRWDAKIEQMINNVVSSSLTQVSSSEPKCIVIVGGGAGGTELSFAIDYRLKRELAQCRKDKREIKFQVVLITRGTTILSEHCAAVQQKALHLMAEKGIRVIFNAESVSIHEKENELDNRYILCKSGMKIPFDEVIWCTQAEAPSWLKDTALELIDGFVAVKATLQSVNNPEIFAVGDVCHLIDSPRPKAGVFAVRAGPPLLENIRRLLWNQPLTEWTPQTQFLSIIGVAPDNAIGSKGPVCIEGNYVWKLKDKIDRNWMDSYKKLSSTMFNSANPAIIPSQQTVSPVRSTTAAAPNEVDYSVTQLTADAAEILSQQAMR